MSVKVVIEWFKTEEILHPPVKKFGPNTWCLVTKKESPQEVVLRPWDPFHNCWNDEQDDDFWCDPEDIAMWALCPDAPV